MPAPALSSLLGAIVVIISAIAIPTGLRSCAEGRRRQFEIALATANIVLLVASKTIEARHGFATFAWLPLHVCDVSSVACALALLRRGRLSRATTLYFGVGLSTFALLFPDIGEGPASTAFWVFWLRHAAIMLTGFYDLIVRGYRPTWSDYARWCAFGAAYVAVVSLVNAALHTNFAFIADQTLQSSALLQSFGAWPTRSVVMLGLALLHAAAITLVVQSLPGDRTFDHASQTHG